MRITSQSYKLPKSVVPEEKKPLKIKRFNYNIFL